MKLLLERQRPHLPLRGGRPSGSLAVSPAGPSTAIGILDLSQLEDKIRPDNEHYVRTRLVCLENTHNQAGGRVYPIEKIQAISRWAQAAPARHASGRRPPLERHRGHGHPGQGMGRSHFDSVSVCFSKGLGAPIGSAPGRRRKRSSPRVGVFASCSAAACARSACWPRAVLYALDHHVERLAEDHANAKHLSQTLADIPGVQLTPAKVETNLIWFTVDPKLGTSSDVAAALKAQGVLVHAAPPHTLRACTHLDVSASQVQEAAEKIRKALQR